MTETNHHWGECVEALPSRYVAEAAESPTADSTSRSWIESWKLECALWTVTAVLFGSLVLVLCSRFQRTESPSSLSETSEASLRTGNVASQLVSYVPAREASSSEDATVSMPASVDPEDAEPAAESSAQSSPTITAEPGVANSIKPYVASPPKALPARGTAGYHVAPPSRSSSVRAVAANNTATPPNGVIVPPNNVTRAMPGDAIARISPVNGSTSFPSIAPGANPGKTAAKMAAKMSAKQPAKMSAKPLAIPADAEADRLLSEAWGLIERGDYEPGRSRLRDARKQSPDDPRTDFSSGLLDGLVDGNWVSAEKKFSECVRFFPEDVPSLNNLAIAKIHTKRELEAAKLWKTIVDQHAATAEVVQNLGRVRFLIKQGEIRKSASLVKLVDDLYTEAAVATAQTCRPQAGFSVMAMQVEGGHSAGWSDPRRMVDTSPLSRATASTRHGSSRAGAPASASSAPVVAAQKPGSVELGTIDPRMQQAQQAQQIQQMQQMQPLQGGANGTALAPPNPRMVPRGGRSR